MSKRHSMTATARKTAGGAILSALAVTLLFIGGAIELFDMTSAAIASLAVLVALSEFGRGVSFCVYLVASVLSFILMPLSSSCLYFSLVIGYYPLLKQVVEQKLANHRALALAIKALCFNVGCGIVFAIFIKLYGFSELSIFPNKSVYLTVATFAAVLNIFLVVFDLLLGYIGFLYVRVLSKKIFPKA